MERISAYVEAHVGSAVEVLRTLPEASVHSCITSPPYFGLRSYLKSDHPQKSKEIGAEKSLDEYIERMVDVFREVRRVLRDDGSLWLNLGDSYATAGGSGRQGKTGQRADRRYTAEGSSQKGVPRGLKAKDLIGVPWELAFALRDDGWYLRSGVPWVSRNKMPESVSDRPPNSLEYIFLLTKSPSYYYDAVAVKKPMSEKSAERYQYSFGGSKNVALVEADKDGPGRRTSMVGKREPENGRNRRNGDWWFESVGMLLSDDDEILGFDVNTKGYKGAHFACMPPKLVEPMVKVSTSPFVCAVCGSPRQRVVEKERVPTRPGAETKVTGDSAVDGNRDPQRHVTTTRTVGWKDGCDCGDIPAPAVVLDPFGGSGTTAAVAQQLGRRAILIDLNEDYLPLMRERAGKREAS